MVIFENIDIDKTILKNINIDIDIDKEIQSFCLLFEFRNNFTPKLASLYFQRQPLPSRDGKRELVHPWLGGEDVRGGLGGRHRLQHNGQCHLGAEEVSDKTDQVDITAD